MIIRKIGLVARYLDILLTWRLWNFRTIAYSTMQYAMFVVMRDIRGLAPEPSLISCTSSLGKEDETFATNDRLRMHQQNRYALHRILARLTDYVETQSGQPSRYLDYVSEGKTATRWSTSGPITPSATPTSSTTPPTSPSTATASAACCCCPRASTPATAI